MKIIPNPLHFGGLFLRGVSSLFALCTLSTSLLAVSGDWTLSGGGSWGDFSNWSSTPIVPGSQAGDVINITEPLSVPPQGLTTITLDGTRTAGVLNMGHSGGLYILSGGTLIMDNNGNQAEINFLDDRNGGGNPTQDNVRYLLTNVDLRITNGGLKISKTKPGSNRNTSGTISNTTNDLQWLTLNSATGNFQLYSVISDGKSEDRPDAQLGVLIDSGGGVVFIHGNNTYSGGTVLRNGQLKVHNNNGFGTGLVTLGDASTSANIQLTSQSNGLVFQNNIVISSDADTDYTITINAPLSGTSSSLARIEYAGNVDVQRSVIFQHGQSNALLVFSGDLSGNGALTAYGAASLANIQHQGGVELSGNNSGFTGGITTNNSVRLILGHENALGTGKLTIGTAQANAPQLDASSDLRVATNNAIDWKVDIIFVGSHSLNMGGGNVELGRISGTSTSRKVTVMDSLLGFDGVISSTLGLGITKAGDGILELNGANTYTGATLIEAGTLQGKGSLAGNLSVQAGAKLSTNKAEYTTDNFDIEGSLLLNSGAILEFVYDSSLEGAAGITANGVTLAGALFQLLDLSDGMIAKDVVFTVIANTSANPISGTFSDLNEGDTVQVGNMTFIVSYVGGDGNDFTLTAIPEPSTVAMLASLALLSGVYLRRKKK